MTGHKNFLLPQKFTLSQPCFSTVVVTMISRIYHQSPMQTEQSQPEGKWIMLETRFTEFKQVTFTNPTKKSRGANNAGPDQTAPWEQSNHVLHSLFRHICPGITDSCVTYFSFSRLFVLLLR